MILLHFWTALLYKHEHNWHKTKDVNEAMISEICEDHKSE